MPSVEWPCLAASIARCCFSLTEGIEAPAGTLGVGARHHRGDDEPVVVVLDGAGEDHVAGRREAAVEEAERSLLLRERTGQLGQAVREERDKEDGNGEVEVGHGITAVLSITRSCMWP